MTLGVYIAADKNDGEFVIASPEGGWYFEINNERGVDAFNEEVVKWSISEIDNPDFIRENLIMPWELCRW